MAMPCVCNVIVCCAVLHCAVAANETLAAAQQMAAALLGGVTNVVLLENMLDAATIRNSDERQEVSTHATCPTR